VGEDEVAMATERPTTAPAIAAATAHPAPRLVRTSLTPSPRRSVGVDAPVAGTVGSPDAGVSGLAECSCSSTCVHLNRRFIAGCLF